MQQQKISVVIGAGNGDLLFGQPNNLEEAAETLIDFYGQNCLEDILCDGISQYAGKPVYGVGEFIRNSWFLW